MLKGKVNPTDNDHLFQYGDVPGRMSEAAVLELLQLKENNGLSSSPEHYRNILMGESRGEILTDPNLGARGGELSLQLAFYPLVADSLVLYKNFSTDNLMPWESRKREYALVETTDYTVNETTGAITLVTALAEADTVVADYRHDGGELFVTMRDLVLKMARKELYFMFPNWAGEVNVLTELREEIEAKFFEFNSGDNPKGIGEIDQVHYLVETRKSRREGLRRPYMQGAL